MTTFGSVASGIEAASVAFNPLGWKAAWFAEIEKNPSKLLAHHYPDVNNLGDMNLLPTMILDGEIEAPDVLCGGTPCQAFSVAGLRNSLSDARGNLTLKFVEIANAIDTRRRALDKPPAIVFWENVPGVLNTPDNAFGCFLGALAGEDEALEPAGGKWSHAGCVFGPERAIAWRVLDAQHFGIPQRRRRVFVVACSLERAHPTSILFEFEGLRRDSAPSREPGQSVASTLTGSTGGVDENCAAGGHLQVAFGGNRTSGPLDVSTALNACGTASGRIDFASETFVVESFRVAGDGAAYATGEVAAPLVTGTDPNSHVVLSYSTKLHNTKSNQAGKVYEEYTPGLDRSSPPPAVVAQGRVRRLMPVECERLQGLGDFYTDVAGLSDSARYKALGNSWPIPVIFWIGSRINEAIQ